MQTAEQVVAALTGGVVSTAVNIPAVSAEDMEVLGPFLPLVPRARPPRHRARRRRDRARRVRVPRPHRGRDTRLLTLAALNGVLAGHTEEEVNLVNAPVAGRGARDRGRRDASELVARDFTDLVRITVGGAARAWSAPRSASRHRPHLLEAWGQRFNLQLDDGHFALFRYSDLPGMIGRVGTVFGKHGVNISQAAVGREPPGEDGHRGSVAVMAVTTDGPVPQAVVDEIVASDGFVAGRAVSL